MAGVLGQLFKPQKRAMYRDPTALELETAKEILAESLESGSWRLMR